tara:strand:- start:912 stop:1097 length:186 start_codon:yes stop_codon:yes gene_type:complete
MKDNMIRIEIAGRCPTGTTEHWCDYKVIYIHEALAYDFVQYLIDYAVSASKAEHWQYFEEE